MGCLFGFIISFLGAAIFDIARRGCPFLPLQTLWINFTTPAVPGDRAGLRHARRGPDGAQAPSSRDQPILTRGGFAWLASVRAGHGGRHRSGVISWAEQVRTQEIAHTMGVVTFSLYALFFSITTKDERRTVFSLDRVLRTPSSSSPPACPCLTLLLTTVFPVRSRHSSIPPASTSRQWSVCVLAVGAIHRRRLSRSARPFGGTPHPAISKRGDQICRSRVNSEELGRLRRVMVHRPGLERHPPDPVECGGVGAVLMMCCRVRWRAKAGHEHVLRGDAGPQGAAAVFRGGGPAGAGAGQRAERGEWSCAGTS